MKPIYLLFFLLCLLVTSCVQNTRSLSGSSSRENFRVEQNSIEPSNRLQPGDEFVAKVRYSINQPGGTAIPVEESKSLWFKGKIIKNIGNELVYRDNGTWESTLSMQIPKSAKEGKYEIRHEFFALDVLLISIIEFTVYR